ncbi:MAG: hypothetical protein ACR2GE_14225 [Pseudonocardia sp.]
MRIESLDWTAIEHSTLRVSATEIAEVFENGPMFRRNKRYRAADYYAIGYTVGGKKLRVNFRYLPATREARPISAWEI